MNKPLYKFYDLENLTQEDLNKLALERNIYKSIIDKIKKLVENNTELYKHDIGLTDYRTTMNTSGFIKALLELLEEVNKGGEQ